MSTAGPYRVRVVSSYIYEKNESGPYANMGRQNRWVNGFVSALVRQRSGLREFDMQFVQTPGSAEGICELVAQFRREGVQLLICPGTDTVVRLQEFVHDIPLLYFGAHPENNGMELLRQKNISGVRLSLPLVWSWDTFARLKDLVPQLERVYFPLNLHSEFAFPNVRENYSLFRKRHKEFWIQGTSSNLGYRSVAFLAERLGVQYFEGPYSTSQELLGGLAEADLQNSMFIGFNDTTLNGSAVDALLAFTIEKRQPLVWVNNASIIQRAGLADFSSDFEGVGRLIGQMTLSILRDGRPIDTILFADDPGQKTALNLKRCCELGLDVPQSVQVEFDEVFA